MLIAVSLHAATPVPEVYKAFGLSPDGRYFLYLKSNAGFPTFALHCFDTARKSERLIADSVHNAAWAPNSLKLAYISLDSATHFRLVIHDLVSESSREVFSGTMDPAFLEWSSSGDQLRFVTIGALTETSFENQSYTQVVHEFDLHLGADKTQKELTLPSIVRPDVISLDATAVSTFLLPFQGSAYLVQGGTAFSEGVCDGRRCLAGAHVRGLGGALDWQQTPEDGQGNLHILAVADGTVAAVANNVKCNSVNRNCRVGYDDYRSPCQSNDGAGNYVLIAHSDGSYSLYAHLKSGSVQVSRNQIVTRGTYLGDQGHSGSANSTTQYRTCGDHIHFQRQKSPAVFSPSIPTDFGEAPCTLSCLTGYVSANVEKGQAGTSPLSVTLAPTTVIGSVTTVGNKVLLRSAAPSGGAKILLSSSDPGRASVPASVTVAAGLKWASFPVTINGDVSVPMPVVISALRGGSTATADLVISPPAVARLALAAATVVGGKPLKANEVAMNGIAAHNVPVQLTSSKPAVVQIPAAWTVEQGSSFGLFNLKTSKVTVQTTVTIRASSGGVTKVATLTVKPSIR